MEARCAGYELLKVWLNGNSFSAPTAQDLSLTGVPSEPGGSSQWFRDNAGYDAEFYVGNNAAPPNTRFSSNFVYRLMDFQLSTTFDASWAPDRARARQAHRRISRSSDSRRLKTPPVDRSRFDRARRVPHAADLVGLAAVHHRPETHSAGLSVAGLSRPQPPFGGLHRSVHLPDRRPFGMIAGADRIEYRSSDFVRLLPLPSRPRNLRKSAAPATAAAP